MTGFHARELDVTTPSVARMYDYLLGGTHNYAVDRVRIDQIMEQVPTLRESARDNRQFLTRAVEFCMQAGIRQFLDLGSGIPTVGNVHQIAHAIDPATRVVYVDNDHEAVVTSKEMLESIETATCIAADVRDPDSILNHPDTLRLIDFTEPVGLLMVAVLHFVRRENDAPGLVRTYADNLRAGSYLAISHAAREGQEQWEHLYNNTSNPVILRSRQEVIEFFVGFDIQQPGVVMAPEWLQPESDRHQPSRFGNWAAVGLKP
jgi:hypothetical protein